MKYFATLLIYLLPFYAFGNPKIDSIKNMDERYPVEFNLALGAAALALSFLDLRKNNISEFQKGKAIIIGGVGVALLVIGVSKIWS